MVCICLVNVGDTNKYSIWNEQTASASIILSRFTMIFRPFILTLYLFNYQTIGLQIWVVIAQESVNYGRLINFGWGQFNSIRCQMKWELKEFLLVFLFDGISRNTFLTSCQS